MRAVRAVRVRRVGRRGGPAAPCLHDAVAVRRPWSVIAAVAVTVALVGVPVACGGDGGDPGGAAGDRVLVGGEWTLDPAASGLPDPGAGVTVTARFAADGSLTGTAGCNRYVAAYEAAGRDLTVDPDVAVTRMACAESAMRLEATFLDRLVAARSHRITGATLTVATDAGGPLTFRGAPDADGR